MKRYKSKCDCQLLAYCLMGNHVHILIHENSVPIGDIIRHLGSAFVYWYNNKYERSGHLFQDRFKSEPVDNEVYLLNVFRYILNNPVKAGICANPCDYPYSSAREYLLGIKGITDRDLIYCFFENNSMRDFVCRKNNDQCLEIEEKVSFRCSDEKAKEFIRNEFRAGIPAIGKKKDRTFLNTSIYRLVRSGISIRQLSRLTGISKKIIENAIKETENRPLSPKGIIQG